MSAQLTAGQAMWGGDPDKDVRLYRSLGHLLQSFERQERRVVSAILGEFEWATSALLASPLFLFFSFPYSAFCLIFAPLPFGILLISGVLHLWNCLFLE